MAFANAFILEALVFSRQMWTKITVGIALAMMILLISWCIGTTLEAGADFSVHDSVHRLKDRLVKFTRGLRGKVSGPGPDVGDGKDKDKEQKSGGLYRSGPSKGTFNFRLRRRGVSKCVTLVSVGPTADHPSDSTGVEINNKEPGDAV
jgi:hypothetical protein